MSDIFEVWRICTDPIWTRFVNQISMLKVPNFPHLHLLGVNSSPGSAFWFAVAVSIWISKKDGFLEPNFRRFWGRDLRPCRGRGERKPQQPLYVKPPMAWKSNLRIFLFDSIFFFKRQAYIHININIRDFQFWKASKCSTSPKSQPRLQPSLLLVGGEIVGHRQWLLLVRNSRVEDLADLPKSQPNQPNQPPWLYHNAVRWWCSWSCLCEAFAQLGPVTNRFWHRQTWTWRQSLITALVPSHVAKEAEVPKHHWKLGAEIIPVLREILRRTRKNMKCYHRNDMRWWVTVQVCIRMQIAL